MTKKRRNITQTYLKPPIMTSKRHNMTTETQNKYKETQRDTKDTKLPPPDHPPQIDSLKRHKTAICSVIMPCCDWMCLSAKISANSKRFIYYTVHTERYDSCLFINWPLVSCHVAKVAPVQSKLSIPALAFVSFLFQHDSDSAAPRRK